MRRRIAILLMFIVLGAIVTIAVAWSSAYFIDVSEWHFKYGIDGYLVDREDTTEWISDVWHAPGGVFVYSLRWADSEDYFGQVESKGSAAEGTPRIARLHRDRSLGRRAVEARGWPMLAFWCEYPAGLDESAPVETIMGGFRAGPADELRHYYYFMAPIVFPYRPVVVGFLVNSLFYGAILWLLLVCPVAMRRMIRRRRGLCGRCGYPIGVAQVCTECGASLARRVQV